MEIKLKKIGEEESELWDKIVYSSSYGTVFHTWKWLKIAEKYTYSNLHPLIAYQGTNAVGIYPIFLVKKGFINIAFSPPPKAYLMYLGPLIIDENLKQDKKEGIFMDIQNEIDRYLFSELKCKYVSISSPPGLFDCRPFRWSGYQVVPRYTYKINLTKGLDHVWEGFDRKLRVDLNKAIREGVVVDEGNKDDVEFIHHSLSKRLKDRGLKLDVDKKYLLELFEEFYPKNNMKIFIANYKGEKIGGMISLSYKNIVYLWEGISKTGLKGISVNDMVQWEAIKWACKNGFSYYDSMDSGNNPKFRSFKSKYNPELVIWFTAVKYSSPVYRILHSIYIDMNNNVLPRMKILFQNFRKNSYNQHD
jgi:hypothetical protein